MGAVRHFVCAPAEPASVYPTRPEAALNLRDHARANLESHLRDNPYPGRGIVVGRADDGFRIVYFIMGRSENSRNRRFVAEGGTLRTEPVDLAKVVDPSLIIYEAMLELPRLSIVSNGDQTRTIRDAIAAGGSFEGALATREREPDAPNYTPRISAMLDGRGDRPQLALSILKASPFDPQATDRFFVRPALPAVGYGLCLTTYRGDGSPLPSFEGEPKVMPCAGSAHELLDHYWQVLDADNRVSLAVKSIPPRGELIELAVRNRHT